MNILSNLSIEARELESRFIKLIKIISIIFIKGLSQTIINLNKLINLNK